MVREEYRLTKRRLRGQVEWELRINKGVRRLFQIDFRAKQPKCSPRRCHVATRNGRSIGYDSEELDRKGGYSAPSEIRGETARERKRKAELTSAVRVCPLLAARLFVDSAHFEPSRPKFIWFLWNSSTLKLIDVVVISFLSYSSSMLCWAVAWA